MWLVGMMGAGKSAVGAALARRLGVAFHDADAWVEERAGRSIARIFAEDGEAAFRALERQAVDALAGQAAVVALGGGAVAQPGIAPRLSAAGVVVYLRARPETLAARVGEGDARPLLAGLGLVERTERLRALLADRASHYALADCSVDTDGCSVEQVAESVAGELQAR